MDPPGANENMEDLRPPGTPRDAVDCCAAASRTGEIPDVRLASDFLTSLRSMFGPMQVARLLDDIWFTPLFAATLLIRSKRTYRTWMF